MAAARDVKDKTLTSSDLVSTARRYWPQYQSNDVLIIAIVLVVMVLFFSIMGQNFATAQNLKNILIFSSVFIILGVGQTFVMTTGGIDISTGSAVGLTATLFGLAVVEHNVAWWLGLLIAMGVGVLTGLFNGSTVVWLKVPPFIATLGTFVTYRGAALVTVHGQVFFGFPEEINFLSRGEILSVPVPFVIAATMIAVGSYILNFTPAGRYMTAIGANPEAARQLGIRVRQYTLLAYIIIGVCVGLSAILLAARFSAVQGTLGTGLELIVIAAVVIGGTNLFGGRGTMFGTALGALVVAVIDAGLILIGLASFWQLVVLGLVLIVAVGARTVRQ